MSDAHDDDPSPEMMKRREILRRVAWMLGGAVSAPAALAILQGCSAKQTPATAATPDLKFLSASQLDTVAEIADIMIPKTETSGAKDAGVPAFIDLMLADVYDKAARDRFSAGFAQFAAAAAVAVSGKPFLEQSRAQRSAYVQQALEQALGEPQEVKPFILMTRELTLLGYFTSQAGITENMLYEAVPTVYHGCVPLTQMKKPVYWE
jgi:hypothetical protein